MGLFDKIIKKSKSEHKENKTYANNLEKRLDQAKIPYDTEEVDTEDEDSTITKIIYSDPLEENICEFSECGEEFIFENRNYTEDEAFNLILSKWKTDQILLKYLEDERYDGIFTIKDFYSNLVSKRGLNDRLIPYKDTKGIKLLYGLERLPTERDYLIGVELTINDKDEAIYVSLPSGRTTTINGAVIDILQKIYEEVPLFFTSGTYKVPEDTEFTDIVKTFLINISLLNHLNGLVGVEAHNVDITGSNKIFILLKNDSAIDYMSPTQQNPNGRISMIDVDEINKVENNEAFPIVSRMLKLPSMITDKPDETQMPKRHYDNRNFINRDFGGRKK